MPRTLAEIAAAQRELAIEGAALEKAELESVAATMTSATLKDARATLQAHADVLPDNSATATSLQILLKHWDRISQAAQVDIRRVSALIAPPASLNAAPLPPGMSDQSAGDLSN